MSDSDIDLDAMMENVVEVNIQPKKKSSKTVNFKPAVEFHEPLHSKMLEEPTQKKEQNPLKRLSIYEEKEPASKRHAWDEKIEDEQFEANTEKPALKTAQESDEELEKIFGAHESDEEKEKSDSDDETPASTIRKKKTQPKFYIEDVIEAVDRAIEDSDDYKSILENLKDKCQQMYFMRRRDSAVKKRKLKSYVHIYREEKTLGFYNNSYRNPKVLKVANMTIAPMITICVGYKDDNNARNVIQDIKTFRDDQYLCTYHNTPKKFKNVVSYQMMEKYCHKVLRYCKRHNLEVIHNNYDKFNNKEKKISVE